MENNLRIQDLSSIYDRGLKPFIEKFLREKVEGGESLVYSLDGKIIELSASDIAWLYTKLSEGPQQWELELLNERAARGADVVYEFSNRNVSIPAVAVLHLLDKVKEMSA